MTPTPIDGMPLKPYLENVVHQTFFTRLGVAEPKIDDYLSNMLLDFVRMDQLYALKNAVGRPLEEVVDMLEEGEELSQQGSYSKERQVHKHIGDFALFWSGLFPESLSRMEATRKDRLINYVTQGKKSYYIVSTFDGGKWKDEAPFFRSLYEQFDLLRYGLNLVRREWEKGLSG